MTPPRGAQEGVVQLLALPGFLAFFVVSLWVGIRLLLLWTRTRQVPELLMGIGVLGIGPLGFGIAMAAFLSAQTSPELAKFLVAIASTTVAMGVGAKYIFNWQIYHPRSRVAKGVVVTALALLACSVVGDGLTNHFVPEAWQKPGFPQLRQVLQVGALFWGSAEAFGWYRRLQRRVAIGLGDALVANRFLLWSIGAGAAGIGSAIGTVVGFVAGRPMTDMPALTLALSLFGLASASSLWLAFVPPLRYLDWIRARVN
jgi:hypothetical protein